MLKSAMTFFQRLGAKWQSDDIGTQGASLAYFALFSLFPLLLVMLSVVSAVIDPRSFDVQQQLLGAIESPELREVISTTLQNLRDSRGQAGLIGFATLLFAASGIFGALDRSMNLIWDVPPPPKARNLLHTVWIFIKDKLVSFALVLGCALLLMLSIASTVVISALSAYTPWLIGSGLLWQSVQFVVALALLALGLSVLYKALPDTAVAWREAALGGLVAALLLTLLQKLIGIYLSQADYTSYGVVGGVMALMIYFFLTGQIILAGAVFAAVFAGLRREGRGEAAPAAEQTARPEGAG